MIEQFLVSTSLGKVPARLLSFVCVICLHSPLGMGKAPRQEPGDAGDFHERRKTPIFF